MGCNQSSSGGDKAKGGAGSSPGAAAPADKDKDKQLAKKENKNFGETMQFLSKVPLFLRLPQDQHPLLAAAVEKVEFKPNQVVIKQGTSGSEFFVIKTGEASVTLSVDGGPPKQVAVLKVKDYFGENALLRDEPRTATITAQTALSCFKITREKFQELGLQEKLQFANRKAVAGGAKIAIETKPPSPKTPQEREMIKNALMNNTNLQTMVPLDTPRINALIDTLWKETITAGAAVIEEGDLRADYFYIIQDGDFEIFVAQGDGEEEGNSAEKAIGRGESKHVSTLSQGQSFGELALLYLVPRAATVKAKTQGTVWVIDRTNFKNILMKVSSEKIEEYQGYLERVEILNPLIAEEKKAIAKALVEMHFDENDIILQQGEAGNTFYILYEGDVSVIQDGNVMQKLSAQRGRATQFFGERALLNNEARAATIKVISKTAKALALSRDEFHMLLGPLEDIIKASEANGRTRNARLQGQPKASGLDANRERIFRKDLQKIGLLGCGGFGTVELWEHKVKKETYAMKGLSKGYVVKTGMQESVMNEKNILMMTNSDFIIKLYETYNGTQTLYFLLEPALGGELYATYNRKGLHGSEKHAKFYVAGVVYAFEHCHDRFIIYRDLKPENLLITETGRVKLTDMGLAKFVIGKTFTTCGTPDYFAPEIIASTGHTNAVDWWMLGILTFELLSGHPPFESAYPMQIYAKVMKGIHKIAFPPKCQGDAEKLIKGLLKKDASERLPMKGGGTKNIKEHKWFANFDWDAMQNCTLDPPYKPVVKSKKDIANFSARKEDMPKQLEYKPDGSGWDKEFATL